MRNATGNPNLKIPDNPVLIDFPRSDGDPRTWPSNTQYVEDNEGNINWMKEIGLEHPIAIKWRLVVGKALAVDIGREPAEKAILSNWPANYKMYDHHKGPARGNVRHDVYLYGPQSRRFRSPNEFVPHALWLCRDPTMDTKNCFCKYCKKIPQKVITGALDSIIQTTPSQMTMSPTPSQDPTNAGPSSSNQVSVAGKDIYSALQKQAWARQIKDRDATSLAQRRANREKRLQQKAKGKPSEGAEVPKVFAAVQKPLVPMSALKPSSGVLGLPMLAQRNRDLRAVYTRSANDKAGSTSWEDDQPYDWPGRSQENPPIRRWFREHELVWARLPGDGIVLQPGSPHKITEWPAVVDEFNIRNTPVPIDPSPNSNPGAGGSAVSPPQGKQLEILSIDRQKALNAPPVGSSSGSSHQSPPTATSPFHPQPPTGLAASSGLFASSSASNAPPAASPPNGAPPTPISSKVPVLPHLPQTTNAAATYESNRAGSVDWTVNESTVYTLRLMGTNQKVNFLDRDVLPYLATVPSEELIELLKTVPVQHMDFDREKISKYDAIAASKGQNDRMDEGSNEDRIAMYDGACAFAFALQIAADVCEYWSLTDRWEFKYIPLGYDTGDVRVNIVSFNSPVGKSHQAESASSASMLKPANPPPTTVQTTVISGGLSLSQAIEQAGRINASVAAGRQARVAETGPVPKEVSSVSASMSEQQVKHAVAGVLGIGPNTLKPIGGSSGPSSSNPTQSLSVGRPAVSQSFTQVRFQGMWWGGERIWVDDFVRLKLGRKAIAPHGAPNVYKASGDGKKAAAFRSAARQQALGSSGSDQDEMDILRGRPLTLNGKGKGKGVDLPCYSELPEGANRRSVFMKINSLFVVDVRKRDGKVKKEGRVSGVLYELADIDWEETEPDLMEEYENEKQRREEASRRRRNASSSFQARVDESLLPSTKLPSTPAPQSSPPSHYLIPQAPKGYRFRRIVKADHEVVLNLSLISGRYYPRLLSHPLLAGMITSYQEDWKAASFKNSNPFALEGLHPGHCSAVDPLIYKKSRVRMYEDADIQVEQQMAEFKKDRMAAEEDGEDDDAMDEDGEEPGNELGPNTMLVD